MAITGFLDVAYVSYLSGEIDAFYPFTSLLVTVGLVGLNATRKAIVDGQVVFKTHRSCMLLQNGLNWRLPTCAVLLVLMHLVLGDPQLKCFVKPIIKVNTQTITSIPYNLRALGLVLLGRRGQPGAVALAQFVQGVPRRRQKSEASRKTARRRVRGR